VKRQEGDPKDLTRWQRMALRQIRKETGREPGEALGPEDWETVWRMHERGAAGQWAKLVRSLPSSPRCGICGAPFAGIGARIVGPMGYRPSRKNPTVCGVCIESSPPGGKTQLTGVMFADLRGFTQRFAGGDPQEASVLLRRFYRAAEDVLFPIAVIDKVIGDEVMALYLPILKPDLDPDDVPAVMLEHAKALLRQVGYGSDEGPFADLGIGLDYGDAFVGNIGQRALYDFTAVGDVVNTASRLQGQAAGGEIVLSARVAAGLPEPVGEAVELTLKGKEQPEPAYRLAV
jgi:adenylate cyclase